MNLDQFLDRTWTDSYTCNEFSCEVWQHITGEDLSQRLQNFLNGTGSFIPIDVPESPCIALFNRKNADSHVGIFFEGKLLHLTSRGVHYVHLEIVQGSFQQPRFYK